jgi:alkanesulfonate monooxygenase SsuD/methylene tetrahydromethanopterin reductase-like flavin-dependent oxidoreductase (luciferase family)
VVRAACAEAGRDPDELTYSFAHVLACGTTEAEQARRADDARNSVPALREAEAFVGSPAEVVDRIGRLAEAGVTRFYLQDNGLADLDHLDLVASQVLPQLG